MRRMISLYLQKSDTGSSGAGFGSPAPWRSTGAGHHDPQLLTHAVSDDTARVIRTLMQRIVVYQFPQHFGYSAHSEQMERER